MSHSEVKDEFILLAIAVHATLGHTEKLAEELKFPINHFNLAAEYLVVDLKFTIQWFVVFQFRLPEILVWTAHHCIPTALERQANPLFLHHSALPGKMHTLLRLR